MQPACKLLSALSICSGLPLPDMRGHIHAQLTASSCSRNGLSFPPFSPPACSRPCLKLHQRSTVACLRPREHRQTAPHLRAAARLEEMATAGAEAAPTPRRLQCWRSQGGGPAALPSTCAAASRFSSTSRSCWPAVPASAPANNHSHRQRFLPQQQSFHQSSFIHFRHGRQARNANFTSSSA